ncbi:MAG: hypothetical protein IKN45_03840 [Lachnospiraceae bacterium]|nr:hypothetical protein [Lachnospiraceae bacterium]
MGSFLVKWICYIVAILILFLLVFLAVYTKNENLLWIALFWLLIMGPLAELISLFF